MVTRVFGRVDGIEVGFMEQSEGLYKVEFPRKLNSGNYIVEVYAEDDAGNVSYCSTLICTIDASGACIHIERFGYRLELIDQSIRLIPERPNIWLEVIPPEKCRGGR